MLSDSRLKELLLNPEFSRTQKILVCLAVSDDKPQSVAEIRGRAVLVGLRPAGKWNVSSLLSAANKEAIRTTHGWELTASGQASVRHLAGLTAHNRIKEHADSLRTLLPTIGNAETAAFVEEAIGCSEAKHHRAAVVLSWVGAVAVLYDYVLTHKIAEFNVEALRREPKWKQARVADDLSRMKEFDFLQVAEAIGLIGKNTKQELEGALKLRNACGHPSSLRVGEARAAAHLEILTLNVFTRF